ncbi:MAG: hypothetical protein C4524_07580 [Candidatus Zixiibacteriota bacterium]|nr:MAG: hypothetical protein C4524_07580 [candidate division Zixibacteria bacterium]
MLILGLLAGTGHALLPDFSKEELIQQCEGIVLGTVQDVRCAWNEEHTAIFTRVTLTVQDQYKGRDLGPQVVLVIPGGQVGETWQRVSDTPTLEPGLRVIVHTYTQEDGSTWIYGWERGVLRVQDEAIPEYTMTLDHFRRLVETTLK